MVKSPEKKVSSQKPEDQVIFKGDRGIYHFC